MTPDTPVTLDTSPTEGAIAFTVTLTEKDMVDGLLLTAPNTRWSLPFIFAALGLSLTLSQRAPFQVGAMLIMAVVGWFVRPLLVRTSARRALANKSETERTVSWRFSPEGIELSAAKSNSHIDWSAIHRFLEGPESLVLYVSEAIVHVLPKHALGPNRVNSLRAIFVARIQPRKKPSRILRVVVLWAVLVVSFLAIWFAMNQRP